MKKINNKAILFILLCMVSITSSAQQTKLVIDNQTPGWLSSKISYGDQQTVEDLKITGYLNGTDFKFLADLHDNQKLKILDLSDANIVHGGEELSIGTNYPNIKMEDNYLDTNLFRLFSRMQKIITPKSITNVSDLYFDCDSVIVNGNFNRIIIYPQVNSTKRYINYLELTEGIDSVSLKGNDDIYPTRSIAWTKMQKLVLPNTITKIANLYLNSKCNGNIVSNIEHPELVKFINCTIESGDTLFVPRGTKERYQDKKVPFRVFKNIVELAPPSSIKLNLKSEKSYKDESFSLSVSIIPADAYYNGLIWKSTDENVITVSPTGKVTATGYGKASVIVCSDKDESIADTCEIKVYEHTTGVSLSQTKAEVNLGETTELSAQTLPLGTSDNIITWSSSNTDIATVNSNGKVTALKLGICTISATAQDGGSVAECIVTVIQPAKSININKHSLSIRVGSYEELQATVSPDNTTYKDVSWTSSNANIAEVSERGIVTAKKAGKTYIKAVSSSNPQVKDSCEVIVLQPVTGIILDETSLTFEEIGKTAQLSATVMPDDASDKAVRWMSSNQSVCTVTNNGVVIAFGPGTSVVTATTVDGGYVAVCVVTVKETSGIIAIDINTLTDDDLLYDVHGRRIQSLQKGIHIIRMNDGTMKKVMVK